ncbi:Fic family protein [Microvirga massiliensis]|uniref:Fic family protein n=1 Tax=Microvirga massiliensis TaxID=1033741 RepID=UPI00062B565B|nr:Fic/DOC family N-terminal domain-containing protein [Microvirga massiliensis]
MRDDTLSPAVRARLRRLPSPYDTHFGVVPAPPPRGWINIQAVAPAMERALEALGRAEAIASELKDPYLLSRILVRQEAVRSSALDGTHSTLEEVLAIEETDGGGRPEARQALAYALVLEDLLPIARERGPDIFSLALLKRLHSAVMSGGPDDKNTPGALRPMVVWIGGSGPIGSSFWNPPPPAEVGPCLRDTVAYLRDEGASTTPQNLVIRMAIAHAHFTAIHPFPRGSGRVGRLLLPLMMAADGRTPLHLSAYLAAHEDDYRAALMEAHQRLNWAALVGFLSDAVVGTVNELETTRTTFATLLNLWWARRRFRGGSASARALELLPHYPVVTINGLSSLLRVSFRQASEAVWQLQEARIVEERTGYARNRIYAAPEVLAIWNRSFGPSTWDYRG